MNRSELANSICPVARSAEIVGDSWTQMILRELFLGTSRFDELQRLTGISPHLLSRRLKRLEAEGIAKRRAYTQRPPRYEYKLTAKGRDLWPVVVALKAWGERWLSPRAAPALTLTHRRCGRTTSPQLVCSDCGEAIDALETEASLSVAMQRERAAR